MVPSKPAAFLPRVQFADTRISAAVRMVPSSDVEGQRASHPTFRTALPARPREDGADLGPLLQGGDDRRHASGIGARPEVDGAFGHNDVGSPVGHALDERLDEGVQLQLAGMRREPVVGRDDDVGAIKEPLRLQRVLDAPDARVDEDQRDCRVRIGADAARVRGSIRIV